MGSSQPALMLPTIEDAERTSPALLAHALMSYLYGLLHNHLEPGMSDINLKKNGETLLNLFLDSIISSD